jgi:hypothetical protein
MWCPPKRMYCQRRSSRVADRDREGKERTTIRRPIWVLVGAIAVIVPGGTGKLSPTTFFTSASAVPASSSASRLAKDASASGAYASSVLSAKPDVFYPLDENRGKTAHDGSGHRRNAAYQAGVAFGQTGPLVSDPKARAVGSNGSPIAVWKGRGLPAGSAPRTLEAWVLEYPPGSGHCCSPNAPIVSYGDTVHGHGFAIGYAGPFNPSVWARGDGGKEVSEPAPVGVYETANLWHLVDVSFAGGSASLYLDGQIIGHGNMSAHTKTPGQGLEIGGWQGIGDIAVYPSALSPEQIDAHWVAAMSASTLMCAGKASATYGSLVRKDGASAYYALGDRGGSQRIAYDSSGHCLNGAYADTTTVEKRGPLQNALPAASGAAGSPAVIAGDESLPQESAPRTLEGWVMEFEPGSGHCCSPTGPVISYGDVAGGHGFAFGLDGPFNPSLWVQGDKGQRVEVPAPISMYEEVNQWQLVDVTFAHGFATLYVDGQPIGGGSLKASTWLPGQGLDIDGWLGIADVAIYSKALSPAQIDAHWMAAESKIGTSCMSPTASAYGKLIRQAHASVYYQLSDRSAGRIAYDSSGSCRNGAYDDESTSVGSGPIVNESASGAVTAVDDQSMAVGSATSLPSGGAPRTVEFWFRSPHVCCAGGVGVQYGNAADHGAFTVGLMGGTSTWIYAQGNAPTPLSAITPMWVRDGAAAIDQKWHLVDVTLSSDETATIFLDGQVIGHGHLFARTDTTGQPLLLGASANGSFDVADAAVYPGALTAATIDRHWAVGRSTGGLSCGSAGSGLYDQAVAGNGPTAFFKLEDFSSSRVAHDSSGHCAPAAYWDPTSGLGPIATEGGTSAGLSAQQHQVLLAGDGDYPAGDAPRTIEAWVRVPQYGSGGIVSYGDVAGGSGFSVGVNGGSVVLHGDGNSEATFTALPPDVLDDGNWHLVDVLYGHGEASVVIDGHVIGADPLTAYTAIPGQGAAVGGCCIGIADVAIYSHILTLGQIEGAYGQSGAWTTASCGISSVGILACFRTAANWWHDLCLGAVHCTLPDRPPDFVIAQASVGEVAQGSESVIATCDGNRYYSLGAGVTAGALPASAIIGFGYVGKPDSTQEPLAATVDNFVSRQTFSFSWGLGVGQQLLTSGGLEGVVYFAGLDASVSFEASYSFPAPGNKPSPSGRCGEGATSTMSFQQLVDKAQSQAKGEVKITLARTSPPSIDVSPGKPLFISTAGVFAAGSAVTLSTGPKAPLGMAEAGPTGDVGQAVTAPLKVGDYTLVAHGDDHQWKPITLTGTLAVKGQ